MNAKLLTLCVFSLLTFTSSLVWADSPNAGEVLFSVDMHCESCKNKIEKALRWHKGVKDLSIKLKELTVRVRFDPRKTSPLDLQAAIEALGYTCLVIPPTSNQP
jgi:copper chaperone CopZ